MPGPGGRQRRDGDRAWRGLGEQRGPRIHARVSGHVARTIRCVTCRPAIWCPRHGSGTALAWGAGPGGSQAAAAGPQSGEHLAPGTAPQQQDRERIRVQRVRDQVADRRRVLARVGVVGTGAAGPNLARAGK